PDRGVEIRLRPRRVEDAFGGDAMLRQIIGNRIDEGEVAEAAGGVEGDQAFDPVQRSATGDRLCGCHDRVQVGGAIALIGGRFTRPGWPDCRSWRGIPAVCADPPGKRPACGWSPW